MAGLAKGVERPTIQVVQAGSEHLDAVIGIEARAFQNEPAYSFIIPDSADRARRLPKAFGVIVPQDLRKGRIFMTKGGEAATLWRTPGHMRDGTWDSIRLGLPYLMAFGGSIGRGGAVAGRITKNLPEEECWYLHYAGCDPAFQGKGFGGAAIRAGLAAADAERTKAYLETADESNLPIYAALGFEIIKRWTVPDGPQFWGMMRAARA